MNKIIVVFLLSISNPFCFLNSAEICLEFIDLSNSEACAAVKKNISETTKKIAEVKNSILDKSKIEELL